MRLSQKKKKNIKPIKFRRSLFWDIDPSNLDPNKYPDYIIERILDYGEINEFKWMAHYYSAEKIKNVMRNSRVVSDRSKALWSMVF